MVKKKKMLILDNDIPLLKKLKINIKKYEVVTTTDVSKAVNLVLHDDDISFIVADIKLKHGKKGYRAFSQLFSKGKSVPGMVMTAFALASRDKQYLEKMGIDTVIEKTGPRDPLSSRLEKKADQILRDRKKRFYPVTKKIQEYHLQGHLLKYKGRSLTIEKWIKEIMNGKHSTKKEEELKSLMVNTCNNRLNRDRDDDYGFPQM